MRGQNGTRRKQCGNAVSVREPGWPCDDQGDACSEGPEGDGLVSAHALFEGDDSPVHSKIQHQHEGVSANRLPLLLGYLRAQKD